MIMGSSLHKINNANIKEWAKNYKGELFDGILCDPPYELGFMGKSWDSTGIAFDTEMWADILKLLKPGGHLLAFSGSRTYHRMAVAIEDAGFEIRDMIEWVYGSGFPKSLNIGKSVEALVTTGNASKNGFSDLNGEKLERGNWGISAQSKKHGFRAKNYDTETTKTERIGQLDPTTDEAKLWNGYGTALKPAHEPCVLARKPLEGTVANNVLKHGTGGLAIDNTRIKANNDLQRSVLFEIIGVCQLDHLLLPANSVELKRFQDDTTNAIKKLCSVLESADTPTSEKTLGTQQEDIIKKVTSCLEETLTENTKLSLNTSGYGKKPTDEISQQDMKSTILTVSKMITDWKICSSSVSQLIEVLLTQAKTLKTTNDVQGRFPSNLIHDGSDEVEAVFPQTGASKAAKRGALGKTPFSGIDGSGRDNSNEVRGHNDNGGSASRFFYTAQLTQEELYDTRQPKRDRTIQGVHTDTAEQPQLSEEQSGVRPSDSLNAEAHRFYYCAKASKSERNAGLEGFEDAERTDYGGFHSEKGLTENGRNPENRVPMKNGHPTVKPLSLTKYLATLIKPPTGGRLLVPFSGSGSEMIGALQAGWEYVEGVELTEEYIPIAEARIDYWLEKQDKEQISLL